MVPPPPCSLHSLAAVHLECWCSATFGGMHSTLPLARCQSTSEVITMEAQPGTSDGPLRCPVSLLWLGPAYMLVSVQDHMVSCDAARRVALCSAPVWLHHSICSCHDDWAKSDALDTHYVICHMF